MDVNDVQPWNIFNIFVTLEESKLERSIFIILDKS